MFSRAVRGAARVAALDRLGPRRVLGQRPAREQLGQVVALGTAVRHLLGLLGQPPPSTAAEPAEDREGLAGRSA